MVFSYPCHYLSPKICLSIFHWLIWVKVVASGIFFYQNYLLLSVVCWILWFWQSNFFLYEYKFTVENKKEKKDIHQASKHLRIPGMILKLLNLTTSNLKQPNVFIKIKNLPQNLTEVDPGLSWHWKKN